MAEMCGAWATYLGQGFSVGELEPSNTTADIVVMTYIYVIRCGLCQHSHMLTVGLGDDLVGTEGQSGEEDAKDVCSENALCYHGCS